MNKSNFGKMKMTDAEKEPLEFAVGLRPEPTIELRIREDMEIKWTI